MVDEAEKLHIRRDERKIQEETCVSGESGGERWRRSNRPTQARTRFVPPENLFCTRLCHTLPSLSHPLGCLSRRVSATSRSWTATCIRSAQVPGLTRTTVTDYQHWPQSRETDEHHGAHGKERLPERTVHFCLGTSVVRPSAAIEI